MCFGDVGEGVMGTPGCLLEWPGSGWAGRLEGGGGGLTCPCGPEMRVGGGISTSSATQTQQPSDSPSTPDTSSANLTFFAAFFL